MNIGLIGLGIMGSGMAANLLAKGMTLVVYNRTREKANPLIEQGATWADNPSDVAQHADILITMLAHPEAVRQSADQFLPALKPNSLWIDCSTVNPSFSRDMATQAQRHQVRFLDAPVTGSKTQATNAELVFLVGGAAQDIQTAQPVFDAIGRKVLHVGEVGMGASLKMVVNMLLANTFTAFAETLALGQALGITQEALLSAIIGGPVAAPFLAGKQAKITSGNYEADFPLQWMHKDLHLAALSAYETQTPLPLTHTTKEVFARAIQEGYGENDFAAMVAFLRGAGG
jgi:3-hydroxyisobutyrate dehydrogenase/glyoxylate/succinic semialdehyde reductase